MTKDIDKDVIRADRGAMIEALTAAGARIVNDTKIGCPFHDDRNPSAAIKQGDDGVWRFFCHAGSCMAKGDVFDIRARATGRSVEDQLRDLRTDKPRKGEGKPKVWKRIHDFLEYLGRGESKVEAAYPYKDADGKIVAYKIRIKPPDRPKTFLEYKAVPGGFTKGVPDRTPLYNLKRVLKAVADRKPVVFVEGEKTAGVLTALDPNVENFAVTTSFGGSSYPKNKIDLTPLSGARVIYWADHDAPDPKTGVGAGVKHMAAVAEAAATLPNAPTPLWLDPEILGIDQDGSDAVDWLEAYNLEGTTANGLKEILTVLAMAIPYEAKTLDPLEQWAADVASGKYHCVDFKYPFITKFTEALIPGTLTVIGGDAGASKSMWLMDECDHWEQHGESWALLAMEDDRDLPLRRLVAQIEGNAELTKPNYVKKHPEQLKAAMDCHKERYRRFNQNLTVIKDEVWSYSDVLKWIEARAQEGKRIICVDPITAVKRNGAENVWDADWMFIMRAKLICRKYGCSLIIVTHPAKQSGRLPKHAPTMEDAAGGTAFVRFTHTILWLIFHRVAMRADVRRVDGDRLHTGSATVNRVITLLKTRNAGGTGMMIGYFFNGMTLRFKERGQVVELHDDQIVEDADRDDIESERGFA